MKPSLIAVFVFFIIACPVMSQAPDQASASRMNDSNLFSLGSSDLGSLQSSVNMFTGDVQFPLNLISAPGEKGMSISLTAMYNSNVQHLADRINEESPTGVMGLGWAFDMPHIVLDHKNTGLIHDDEYFLVEGGSSSQLFYIGEESFTSEDLNSSYSSEVYKSKHLTNWKIRYIRSLERWEIIKDDGTNVIYGDRVNHPSAVQHVIRWGNWIGNTSVVSQGNVAQVKVVNVWNLSKVRNWDGDWAKYNYDKVERKVANSTGSEHTEASYLKSIENKKGYKILFYYGEKDGDEFYEPHTETPEPDAYQERYERLFLSELKLSWNEVILQTVRINYHSLTKLSGGDARKKKRLISSFETTDKFGKFHLSQSFDYYETGNLKGALRSVTSASGSIATFHYNSSGLTLSNTNLAKTISAPSGYKEVKVWQGMDYTVVAWRQLNGSAHNSVDRNVRLYVYWWDGSWKEQFLSNISNVDLDDSNWISTTYRNFIVRTERDFFAVGHAENNGAVCQLRLYSRSSVNGNWNSTGNHNVSIGTGGELDLVTGTNYVAVGRTNRSHLRVLTRVGDGWSLSWQDVNTPAQGSNISAKHTGMNNYLWTGYHDGTWIKYCVNYIDRDGTIQSKLPLSIHSSTEMPPAVVVPSNSFVLTITQDGKLWAHHLDWNIPYSIDRKQIAIGAEPSSFLQSVNNSTLSVNDHQADIMFMSRFNGHEWRSFLETNAQRKQSWRVALGEDYVLWTDNDPNNPQDQMPHMKYFDPNTNTWISGALSYHPHLNFNNRTVGSLWGNYAYSWPYVIKRNNNGWDTDWASTELGPSSGSTLRGYAYVFGSPSLVSHPEEDETGVANYVVFNGGIQKTTYNGKYLNYTDNNHGLNTVVLYNDPTQYNTSEIQLRHVINGQVNGSLKDFPIQYIAIDNKYQYQGTESKYYTAFKFETTDAIMDGSGSTANYHISSVRPGTLDPSQSPYGMTQYSFYNGQYDDDAHLFGGLLSRSPLLRGTLFETKVFDSNGVELSSSITEYQRASRDIFNLTGNKIEVAHTISPREISSTINGLTQVTSFNYHSETNQLISSYQSGYNAKGIEEHHSTLYTYYWQQYDADKSEGLLSPVIKEESKVAIGGTMVDKSISVTTWQFINGKNRPYRVYEKFKSGLQDFTNWNNSGSVGDKWRLLSEVNYNSENYIIEHKDALGNYSTVFYAPYDPSLSILQVDNARYSEVWAENFDNEQFFWTSSGSWVALNGVLSHTNTDATGALSTSILHSGNPFAGDFIFEADFRLEPYATNGAVSFHIDKPASGSGYKVVVSHDGKLELYDNNTLVSSGSTYEILCKWQPVRIVLQNSVLHVYIGNSKVLSASVGVRNGSDIELTASNVIAAFDNFRVYPSDAYATSFSFDYLLGYSKQVKKESGSSNYLLEDEFNNVYSSVNHDMVPSGTSAFYNSYKLSGTYSLTDLNPLLTVVAQGISGFSENFDVNLGQWQKMASGNGSSSSWIWERGILKNVTTGSASSGLGERYVLELPEVIESDRLAVEMLVKIDDSHANRSIGFGAGPEAWNSTEGTSAFWAYFTSGNDLVVNGITYDLNLPRGLTYKLLAVLDFTNQVVDFYVNGKLVANDITFGNSSITHLKKIALFNYGYGSGSREFIIDNVTIYSDPVISSVFADASGSTIQVQSELPDNSVMVSEQFFDGLGRPYIKTRALQQTGGLGFKAAFADWNPGTMQLSGNIANTTTGFGALAYSGVKFDNSPLSRTVATKVPGNDFSLSTLTRVSQHEYHNNAETGYDISEDLATLGLMNDLPDGHYLTSVSVNPDGGEAWIMKDALGSTVLSKAGKVEGLKITPPGQSVQINVGTGSNTSSFACENYSVIYSGYGQNLTILRNGSFHTSFSPSGGSVGTISGNLSVEAGNSYSFIFAGLAGHTMMYIHRPCTVETTNDRYLYSWTTYDPLTNVSTSYSPMYFNMGIPESNRLNYVSTTTYSYEGNVISSQSPDFGIVEYKYDRFGRLRFKQDADGLSGNYFSYWKYDNMGRLVEEGYYTGSFASANPDSDAFPATPATWRKKYSFGEHEKTTYDRGMPVFIEVNNDTDMPAEVVEEYTTLPGDDYTVSTRMHLPGESVVLPPMTTTRDQAGNIVKIEYKLPVGGLDTESVTGTKSLGGIVNGEIFNTTVEAGGSLTMVAGESIILGPGFWAKSGSSFVASISASSYDSEEIRYHYDLAGRLVSVGDATDPDFYAEYTYGSDGAIDEEQLGAYLVNYEYYKDHGMLNSIEQTDLGFKETYSYNDGMYGGNYSGYFSRKVTKYNTGGSTYAVDYRYDKLGRLLNGNTSGFDQYDETMRYDMNGNLTSLQRGSTFHNFTYLGGTNKISAVSSHGAFSYDGRGNVTSAPGLNTLSYDAHIFRTKYADAGSGNYSHFKYGAADQRVEKESHAGANVSHTWYLYSGGLQPDLEVSQTSGNSSTTKYIYGAKGLVAIKKGSNVHRTVTDYQGSVRYLSNGDKYHFMPFGGRMAHTNLSTITEDIGQSFQSQEYDEETGLYNFKARFYDPIAGRFYGVDPQGQFHSPYTGMGNNPVMMVDPDGELAFLAIVGIAAAIGGTANWAAQGAEFSWDGLAHFGTGALIGAAAGATGGAISLAGGGAMLAGAGGGFVAGGANTFSQGNLFDGHYNTNGGDILKGAAIGGASGFIGGGVASAIGGGAGAFFGGVSGDITGQFLSTGEVNLGQSLVTGGLSLGVYHATSFAQYKMAGGQESTGMKYGTFNKVRADIQRSRFWRKEYGGWITEDGGYSRAGITRDTNMGLSVDPSQSPKNAKFFHTHWKKGGFEFAMHPDKGKYVNVNNLSDIDKFRMYQEGWERTMTTTGPSPADMSSGLRGFMFGRDNYFYHMSTGMQGSNQYIMDHFYIHFFRR